MTTLLQLLEAFKTTIQETEETLQEKLHEIFPAWVFHAFRWLLMGVSVGILGYLAVNFDFLKIIDTLEQKAYDTRVKFPWWEAPFEPGKDIAILDFDTTTMTLYEKKLGSWPWAADIHASIVETLTQQGVKQIHYAFPFKTQEHASVPPAWTEMLKHNKNLLFSLRLNKSREELEAAGESLQRRDVMQVIAPSTLGLSDGTQDSALQMGANIYTNWRALDPLVETWALNHFGVLNLQTDSDGVVRSAPLMHQFEYKFASKSSSYPFKAHPKYPQFLIDTEGRAVTSNGWIIQPETGKPKQDVLSYWVPSTFFKAWLHTRSENTLFVSDTRMTYGREEIALPRWGMVQPFWFNQHTEEKDIETRLHQTLEPQRLKLNQELLRSIAQGGSSSSPEAKKIKSAIDTLSREIKANEAQLALLKQQRSNNEHLVVTNPYYRIPAWKVLRAIRDNAKRRLSRQDQALLGFFKGKTVMVGLTAEDTGKEVVNTPLGYLDLVTVQSIFYDNLSQKIPPMTRVPLIVNLLFGLLLGGVSGCILWFNRNLMSALVFQGLWIGVYCLANLFLFKSLQIWVDLSLPIAIAILMIWFTYMARSILQAKDFEQAYHMATRDSMTGLYNHRYFKQAFEKWMNEADKKGEKFSLCLIDIDFFKKFNDTYGHQAGDEVLRCVARTLTESVRDKDIVCRYGGEEMAVLVRGADEHTAQIVSQKLVQRIGTTPYKIAEGVEKNVTISVGFATYPTHGRTIEKLIKHSDDGLYAAKENGRNQVGIVKRAEEKPSSLSDLLS
ncbi:MAG: diguanylate cyclase [Vampirovibrionales bacterium]